MSAKVDIQVLINEIDKGLSVYSRIVEYYLDFMKNRFDKKRKSTDDAIIISEVFSNTYTCLETIFLRISQFFENSLQGGKWHRDLLEKMTISIDGIRERVLSDDTHDILLEFLKFRHFRRYYFEFNYDWDKLEFLQKKYESLIPLIKNDINDFIQFLKKLNDK